MNVYNVVMSDDTVVEVYADYAESAEKMCELEGYDVLYAECAA